MKYVLFIVIVLAILWLVRSHRPPSQKQRARLLEDDDAFFDLECSLEDAFDRCSAALTAGGAEVRTADLDRGLFTASFPSRHQHERFLVIIQLEEEVQAGETWTEVSIDYRAASYTGEHEEVAQQILVELVRSIRGERSDA